MDKTTYEKLIYPSFCLTLLCAITSWLAARKVAPLNETNGFKNIIADMLWFSQQDLLGAISLLMALVCCVFLARTLPAAAIEEGVDKIADHPVAVGTLVFLVLAVLARLVYHDVPLSADEFSVYTQAKIFAEGKLTGQFPPQLINRFLPPLYIGWFFEVSPVSGKFVSFYWPGFALLLAPFMKIGLPWLLNALFGAGSVVLVGYLARKIFSDKAAAGWAMLFALASPAFSVNALSYFTMSGHLFLNLLFASLLIETTNKRLLAAGAVGSLALVLHHPFPHLLFGTPWVLWLALRPERFKNLALLFAGYAPLVLTLGFGWFFFRIGLGGQGMGSVVPNSVDGVVGRTLTDLLPRTSFTFSLPNQTILGNRLIDLMRLVTWAVPGLPVLALIGMKHARSSIYLRLLLYSALMTLVGYSFVVLTQQNGWGFRFFHSAWGVVPVLAAGAMVGRNKDTAWSKAVACLVLISLTVISALRLAQVDSYITQHQRQSPCLKKSVKQICFINEYGGYYSFDLIQNDPFLRDPRWIFAGTSRLAENAFMYLRFPDARLIKDDGTNTVWLLP